MLIWEQSNLEIKNIANITYYNNIVVVNKDHVGHARSTKSNL
jgi:hypothetical protein